MPDNKAACHTIMTGGRGGVGGLGEAANYESHAEEPRRCLAVHTLKQGSEGRLD